MEFLSASHDLGLVLASCLIALVAGFTGLTLTKDLSARPVAQKKIAISLAAVALGGGIWSMHFVAMLGLQLPILFYYDAAITLASALLAILIVGAALTLLHFLPRTPSVLTGAGALIGIGVLAMHYLGMSGLELCRAVYTPAGLVLSVIAALALCIAAIWIAYGHRTDRNILLGTLCFGAAVVGVHFAAMAGTRFTEVPTFSEFGPVMSNEVLALGVIVTSFVICGAFLWMGVSFLIPQSAAPASEPEPEPAPAPAPRTIRIPCEAAGQTVFLEPANVSFVRAEGHYTQVYASGGRHFCTWPINEARKRLAPEGFLNAHRSYLINPSHVTTFERLKDNAICRFADPDLPPVPISRSNLKSVRAALDA